MRVGVDALYAVPQGGGGTWTYLHALMQELPRCDPTHEYVVFANREGAGQFASASGAVSMVACPVTAQPPAARLAYEYSVLPVQLCRHGIDVVFAPSFTLPASPVRASVVTIHDMRHEDLPQTFPAAYGAVLRRLTRDAARRATCVLTDSWHARTRILACYNLPPDRVYVTPLAVDPAYFTRASGDERARVAATYGVRAPYVFSVARPSWQKNLAVLVDAFIALRKLGGAPLQLVLTGWRRPEEAPELWAKLRAAGLDDAVRLLGWVPDNDLPILYQSATVHVVPARYEGFGLPVLEAMASEAPVIASSATSLPEVAGGAALHFAPDDCTALVAALRHVTNDAVLRARLIARGKIQARRFTWRNTAEITLTALERAVYEKRRA